MLPAGSKAAQADGRDNQLVRQVSELVSY